MDFGKIKEWFGRKNKEIAINPLSEKSKEELLGAMKEEKPTLENDNSIILAETSEQTEEILAIFREMNEKERKYAINILKNKVKNPENSILTEEEAPSNKVANFIKNFPRNREPDFYETILEKAEKEEVQKLLEIIKKWTPEEKNYLIKMLNTTLGEGPALITKEDIPSNRANDYTNYFHGVVNETLNSMLLEAISKEIK